MEAIYAELAKVLAKLDSRLEHLERDLCSIKSDTKFKQLLIVLLLSSMLGINVLKSVSIRSIEGFLGDDSYQIQPDQLQR